MPCSLQFWSAVADIVGALVTVVALPIAAYQVFQQRKESRNAALARLASLTHGRKLRAAMDFVRTADRELLRQKPLENREKERHQVKAVVEYLRTLATEIQYGVIPLGAAYDSQGEPALELAQCLQQYIQDMRKKRGEEDRASDIDWLMEEFKGMKARRS